MSLSRDFQECITAELSSLCKTFFFVVKFKINLIVDITPVSKRLLWRVIIILKGLMLTIVMFLIFYYFSKIFIKDTFIVNSSSMKPTIMPGDKIVVNKLLFGARIYTDFKFKDGSDLRSFRIYGIRDIERNDIIVFNYPFDKECVKIQFRINYVYTKRVIGLPGDIVSISGGYYRVAGTNEELGNIRLQKLLSASQSKYLQRKQFLFPNHPDFQWTIINFGPYYIPRKGDTIELTKDNTILYKTLIEYETGKETIILKSYTFKYNYLFVAGDNIFSSKDSRYFGVIPEDYIIGVVTKVIQGK